MQEYFQIGIITGAHGIKGEIRVLPTTDYPDRFKALEYISISTNRISSPGFDPEAVEKRKVISVKYHKSMVIMAVEGVEDRGDADRLRGMILVIARKDAVKLGEDEHFIADIIGCIVYDDFRGRLGEIKDILTTGSNDVYIVESETYGEILIPVIKDVVNNIDPVNKRVDVKLPEGIIDD